MNRVKDKKRVFKTILQLLILVLIGGYFTTNIVQSTFAFNIEKKPNVILTINGNGSISQEGSLFGDGLLYPSRVEDAEEEIGGVNGIIRIVNRYDKINVSNLAVGVNKDELQISNSYPRDIVYNSFLNDIQLKIERGSLFSFDKTLIDYTSIGDLLYQPGNEDYNGYTLGNSDEFTIDKDSAIDLKYTLHMTEKAGEELEAVVAKMSIYINGHKNPIIDDDDDYHSKHSSKEIIKDEPITEGEPHWAHDCIITLLDHQIIHGYTNDMITIEDYLNGTIDPTVYVNEIVLPERFITRAETAVLIGRALGLEEEYASSTKYIDSIPNWAKGYVIATTKANIFEGYPSGLFKANNYITREEMISVLIRAFNIVLENKFLELPFKDKDEIGNWAVEYVKTGYGSKIIEGYPDNTYKPKNTITRAETFTIICKLMGLHEVHQIMRYNN